MSIFRKHAKAFPLTTFFALAYLLTWVLLPFSRTSVVFSLLALCGPAAAALMTAAMCGRTERSELWDRVSQWRARGYWYLLALLLPLPISALRSGMEYLLGAPGPLQVQPISTLSMIVFVLVVGEEIGWRGFAMPRLTERVGWVHASLIIGSLWAFWHLPLFFMAGMPQYGTPFLPYIGYTIGLSVILSALTLSTAGSVIIATLFHGAVNTFGIVNVGTTPGLRGWSNAVSYGLAACLIAWLGTRHGRPGSARTARSPVWREMSRSSL
jgi:membrane protease YdiL (CAAX protease family)